MVWSLALDDFKGQACSTNTPYPLLKAVVMELNSTSVSTPTTTTTTETAQPSTSTTTTTPKSTTIRMSTKAVTTTTTIPTTTINPTTISMKQTKSVAETTTTSITNDALNNSKLPITNAAVEKKKSFDIRKTIYGQFGGKPKETTVSKNNKEPSLAVGTPQSAAILSTTDANVQISANTTVKTNQKPIVAQSSVKEVETTDIKDNTISAINETIVDTSTKPTKPARQEIKTPSASSETFKGRKLLQLSDNRAAPDPGSIMRSNGLGSMMSSLFGVIRGFSGNNAGNRQSEPRSPDPVPSNTVDGGFPVQDIGQQPETTNLRPVNQQLIPDENIIRSRRQSMRSMNEIDQRLRARNQPVDRRMLMRQRLQENLGRDTGAFGRADVANGQSSFDRMSLQRQRQIMLRRIQAARRDQRLRMGSRNPERVDNRIAPSANRQADSRIPSAISRQPDNRMPPQSNRQIENRVPTSISRQPNSIDPAVNGIESSRILADRRANTMRRTPTNNIPARSFRTRTGRVITTRQRDDVIRRNRNQLTSDLLRSPAVAPGTAVNNNPTTGNDLRLTDTRASVSNENPSALNRPISRSRMPPRRVVQPQTNMRSINGDRGSIFRASDNRNSSLSLLKRDNSVGNDNMVSSSINNRNESNQRFSDLRAGSPRLPQRMSASRARDSLPGPTMTSRMPMNIQSSSSPNSDRLPLSSRRRFDSPSGTRENVRQSDVRGRDGFLTPDSTRRQGMASIIRSDPANGRTANVPLDNRRTIEMGRNVISTTRSLPNRSNPTPQPSADQGVSARQRSRQPLIPMRPENIATTVRTRVANSGSQNTIMGSMRQNNDLRMNPVDLSSNTNINSPISSADVGHNKQKTIAKTLLRTRPALREILSSDFSTLSNVQQKSLADLISQFMKNNEMKGRFAASALPTTPPTTTSSTTTATTQAPVSATPNFQEDMLRALIYLLQNNSTKLGDIPGTSATTPQNNMNINPMQQQPPTIPLVSNQAANQGVPPQVNPMNPLMNPMNPMNAMNAMNMGNVNQAQMLQNAEAAMLGGQTFNPNNELASLLAGSGADTSNDLSMLTGGMGNPLSFMNDPLSMMPPIVPAPFAQPTGPSMMDIGFKSAENTKATIPHGLSFDSVIPKQSQQTMKSIPSSAMPDIPRASWTKSLERLDSQQALTRALTILGDNAMTTTTKEPTTQPTTTTTNSSAIKSPLFDGMDKQTQAEVTKMLISFLKSNVLNQETSTMVAYEMSTTRLPPLNRTSLQETVNANIVSGMIAAPMEPTNMKLKMMQPKEVTVESPLRQAGASSQVLWKWTP